MGELRPPARIQKEMEEEIGEVKKPAMEEEKAEESIIITVPILIPLQTRGGGVVRIHIRPPTPMTGDGEVAQVGLIVTTIPMPGGDTIRTSAAVAPPTTIR